MTKTVKKPSQAAAKPASKNLPAKSPSKSLSSVADFDTNDGFENVTAKDVIIPRLTILQDMSPQLKAKKPEYIKGASVGDFCNVATGKILTNPFTLIPCFYAMVYLRWAPRDSGKGLIANYGTDGSMMEKTERDEKGKNLFKDGSYLAETATYFVLVQDEEGDWSQAFLPMSSTQLKNSKRWMTKLKAEKIARPDGSKFNPAIYYRAWNASTHEESNNEGDWLGWSFEPADPINDIDPSKELLSVAKEFCRQAKVGLVRGDVEGAAREAHDNEGAM